MFSKIALLVLVAFAVRTAEMVASHLWAHPLLAEPTEEVRIAQNVAAGRGYVTPFYDTPSDNLSPSAHSPPGFVYFLAGFIRLGALVHCNPIWPYRLATLNNAFIGAIAVAFLAVAGKNLAGLKGFYVVGFVATFWPTLITQSVALWDTAFSILALSIGIWIATLPRASGRISAGTYAFMGLLGGIATLLNPLTAPFLAAVFASRILGQSHVLRASFVVVGIWLLCIMPWTIRNAAVFHRFIPIRDNFGLELWLGNQPGCDGTTPSAAINHPRDNPLQRHLLSQLGESAYMQLKLQQAVQIIRDDPSRFARMTEKRAVLYWFGDVHRPTRLLGARFPMLNGVNVLKVLTNGLFLVAAVACLATRKSLPGRWALALGLLIFPAPYYFTHVAPNYRVFVDPILCLLASVLALSICRAGAHNPIHRQPVLSASLS
jgi:hypothetical protein